MKKRGDFLNPAEVECLHEMLTVERARLMKENCSKEEWNSAVCMLCGKLHYCNLLQLLSRWVNDYADTKPRAEITTRRRIYRTLCEFSEDGRNQF